MKRRDFVLIGSVLLIALLLSLLLALLKQEGAYVLVRVDGEEVGAYSLSQDGEYALNGGTNLLVIEDGAAYLKDANCPDHLCVKQGKIDKTNETITCLPNRLTVTVYGAQESVELVG